MAERRRSIEVRLTGGEIMAEMVRRISSPRLIERQQELELLDQSLERACLGYASVELILGEAGIGKTRLVSEIEERGRERGMLVLHGNCVELETGELPYGPLVAAMGEVPKPALEASLAGLSPLSRAELARAFPQLFPAESTPFPAAAEYGRDRLFEFLLALVRVLADNAPLLVVLEDFQWADRSTRDAISFLTRNLRRERIAILITCRADELPRRHPVRRMLTDLTRLGRVQCTELPALSRGGVQEQIAAIAGGAPPQGLVDALYIQSGGNPFFVEELLAARHEHQNGALPERLADLVLVRFHQLSADARRVVETMAVIGRSLVDPPLLRAATDIDEPALSAHVREAVLAHVLTFARDEGGFCFRHAIVRTAVEQTLLPGERAILHGAVARALEHSVRRPSHAELASHWLAADEPGRALVASVRAGLESEWAHASPDALAHFERARALHARLGAMPESSPLAFADLIERAATAARSCGDYRRVVKLCDEGLSVLDQDADPRRAARLLELRGLSQMWSAPAEAFDALRAAELRLPVECTADRIRVLGAQGLAYASAFDWTAARDRCTAALALAAGKEAEGDAAYARIVLGIALAFLGRPADGEAELLRAKAVVERLQRDEDLMRVHVYLGEVLRLQGRFADAAELMRNGERIARRVGMQGAFGRYMLANAAADLFQLGRWDEAAQLVEANADAEMASWARLVRHIAGGQLAVGRGAFAAANDHLKLAQGLCQQGAADFAAGIAATRAELALWNGLPDDARGVVASTLGIVSRRGDGLNSPLLFWVGARAAADAAVDSRAIADRARESDAVDEALDRLDALDALLAQAPSHLPATARWYRAMCFAETLRAAGEAASDSWRDTAAGWDECDMPYRAAYARWRAAEDQLTAFGGRAAAADDLRQAHETAVALGAKPLRRAVETLAQRARLDLHPFTPPRRPAPALVDAHYGLTPRELEVLALIGLGLTNREIGERLFISKKTADVHVSHILGKLDVRTRVLAAGMAERLGLVEATVADPDARIRVAETAAAV